MDGGGREVEVGVFGHAEALDIITIYGKRGIYDHDTWIVK